MEDDSQIVIDVQMDALIASLQELRQQYQANAAALKALDKESETYEADVIKLEQQQKVLKQEMSGVEKQIQNNIKAEQAQEDSLVALRAKLANLNKQYDSMSGVERMGKAGLELRDRMKALHDQLLDLEGSTGRMQRNVGNYPEAIVPVKQQLKELTEQLIQLRSEGKQNTQEYQEMLVKAGQLKDAMEDTSKEMKQMASDTSALNSVLDAGKFAAGAFSAALGVMTLFGDEDSETAKELAEAQKKLQAAIAITTGLQAVQNALQKESALMMGINKIQMWAAAKAQDEYTRATGRATIAQRAFNIVAKSNPYVLLATAILSVVGAIALFRKGEEETEEQIKETNHEIEKQVDIIQKLENVYMSTSKRRMSDYEREIELMKARGDSIEDIRKKEDAMNKEALLAIQAKETMYAEGLSNIGFYEYQLNEAAQNYASVQNEIADLVLKRGMMEEEQYNEAIQNAQQRQKYYSDEIDNLQSILNLLYGIKNERKDYDAMIEKQNIERANEDRRLAEQRQQAYIESLKKQREEAKKFNEEIHMLSLDERRRNNKQLAEEIKRIADSVGLFDEQNGGLQGLQRLNEEMQALTSTVEDAPSAWEDFSASFLNNATIIESTSASLESAFSSISSMYQQMARDESLTEQERQAAAQKAKTWAKIQVGTNAATAIAKGTATAVDVGFPAAIPAIIAMTASILSAIAQAKSMLSTFDSGGVIGGYRGASMGADNTVISARNGEMVLNAEQQRRLFEIANTRSEQPNTAEQLAEAIRLMPPPVLEYSEFKQFTDNILQYDEGQKTR